LREFFWASALFGKTTVSTPDFMVASILSASTPSGSAKLRRNPVPGFG